MKGQTKAALHLEKQVRLLFAVPYPTKEDWNSQSEWGYPGF